MRLQMGTGKRVLAAAGTATGREGKQGKEAAVAAVEAADEFIS